MIEIFEYYKKKIVVGIALKLHSTNVSKLLYIDWNKCSNHQQIDKQRKFPEEFELKKIKCAQIDKCNWLNAM